MMSFWVVPWSSAARRALLVGDRDIERHQPGRGGVDGHRGIHRREWDLLEQRPHVADVGDRDADLTDLAAGEQDVIAVETGLGRQVESDREAGLSLGQVLPVEPIGFARGRMPGIGAEDPGLVAARRWRRSRWFVRLGHGPLGWARPAAPAPKVLCMAQLQKISRGATPSAAAAPSLGTAGTLSRRAFAGHRSATALTERTVASRPPTTTMIVR